jgi:hypothetical protein
MEILAATKQDIEGTEHDDNHGSVQPSETAQAAIRRPPSLRIVRDAHAVSAEIARNERVAEKQRR